MANPWEEYAAPQAASPQANPWEEYSNAPVSVAPTVPIYGQAADNAPATSLQPPPTTPQGLAAAMQQITKAPPAFISSLSSGNPMQDLAHGAGLAARMAINGGTGLTGMVSDLPFQIANLFGANQQLPTTGQNQLMDKYLGTPQNGLEKAAVLAGSMALGSRDPAMMMLRGAPQAAATAVQTPEQVRAATLNAGMDAGYKLTPSQTINPGLGSQALEAGSGSLNLKQTMAARNQVITDQLAARAAGLPPGSALTDDTLNNAIGATYAQGYEPIRQIPLLNMGTQYTQDLRNIAAATPTTGVGNFNPADVAQAYHQPFMGGAEAVDNIRTLRQLANDATGSNAVDKTLRANTYQNLANAIENGIGRALPAGSSTLSDYQAARTQIAKQYAVKQAIVDGTGSVNAANIGSQLANGAPFTDELAVIGNMARTAPKAVTMPKAATPALTHIDQGLLSGAVGAFLKGGVGLASGLAAAGVVRPAVRAALLSNPYQQAFIRPNIQPGTLSQLLENPNVQNALPATYQGLFGPKQ